MIGAIAWKEWREQRFFGTLLTVVGMALLIALVTLTDSSANTLVIRRLGAILIVITIGIVSGAMLLASEVENRTQWFLDRTPVSRFRIARAKLLFGLGFTLVQTLIIADTGIVIDCFPPEIGLLLLAVAVPSFIVGACGSALAQSVLAAAGIAVILLIGCFSIAYALTFQLTEGDNGVSLWLLLNTAFLSLPVAYSMWVYTRPDRLHRQGGEEIEAAQSPLRWGIGSLLWLVFRQTRVMVVIMAVVAGMMGVMMMRPTPISAFMWVTLSAILGMVVGVMLFVDEHRYDAERFWGERRLPVRRLWTVKMITHIALVCGLFALFALPNVLAVEFRPRQNDLQMTPVALAMHSTMISILQGGSVVFFFVGPIYGFAVGQLAGLLFRKPLVASVVTLLSVVPWLALWMPSFIAGDVHLWQWLLPPLALIITSRLLMHRWASDRLKSGRGILIGAGGVSAAIGLTALGLVYRAIEVPNVPDAFVASGYESNLMPFEANEAGRLLRQSAENFDLVATPSSPREQNWFNELLAIDAKVTPELAEQINAWQSDDWQESLRQSQQHPLGMLEDPRLLNNFTPMRYSATLKRMSEYLAVQGLLFQLQDKPEAFLDRLDSGIWIMRNTRSHAPFGNLRVMQEMERDWAQAIRVWASRLRGHPEWLKRAQIAWGKYLAEPLDVAQLQGAAQLVARNTLQSPRLWLRDFEAIYQEPLVNWLAFAWNVPWERERHERELRVLSDPVSPRHDAVSLWLRLMYRPPMNVGLEPAIMAGNQVALLDLALQRYALDHEEFPEELSALVPNYLERIPLDPLDAQPFRYRRSNGDEYIEMEERPRTEAPMILGMGMGMDGGGIAMGDGPPGMPLLEDQQPLMDHPPTPDRIIVEVKKGNVILWSLGYDQRDDGGLRLDTSKRYGVMGEDWIWIVRRSS